MFTAKMKLACLVEAAEASMDLKPNACTWSGLGIEPGLSGTQHWGRTAAPPLLHKVKMQYLQI